MDSNRRDVSGLEKEHRRLVEHGHLGWAGRKEAERFLPLYLIALGPCGVKGLSQLKIHTHAGAS